MLLIIGFGKSIKNTQIIAIKAKKLCIIYYYAISKNNASSTSKKFINNVIIEILSLPSQFYNHFIIIQNTMYPNVTNINNN